MSDNAYHRIPYITRPLAASHPDRLASVATLFGMSPAPVASCRVLELGCGSGGNLIPMAYRLPGSRFTGIDLAERAIAEGRRVAGGARTGESRLGRGRLTRDRSRNGRIRLHRRSRDVFVDPGRPPRSAVGCLPRAPSAARRGVHQLQYPPRALRPYDAPPEHAKAARQAQQAWAAFWEIGCSLAKLNRDGLRKQWQQEKQSRTPSAGWRDSHD